MKKNPLKNIDNQIHGIVEDNKELIGLKWERDKLKDKYCDDCKKDLADYKEGLGAEIMPGEYLVMMDIRSDKVGDNTFYCYECTKKFGLPPSE